MNLSASQQNALKDIAILAAVYLATKTASAVIRYGVIAGVGYLLYQNLKSVQAGTPGLSGGWRVKVDPAMAVDMMFPKLEGMEKHFAKMAANTILNGLMPQGPGFSHE